jgi:hypothetical protein
MRPGSFDQRIQNDTGAIMTDLSVAYQIASYNNQPNGNTLNLSYSSNDSSYTAIPALDFATLELADPTPSWAFADRSTTITGLNIADGNFFYLRWNTASTGSGNSDGLGLNSVTLTVIPEPAAAASGHHPRAHPPHLALRSRSGHQSPSARAPRDQRHHERRRD